MTYIGVLQIANTQTIYNDLFLICHIYGKLYDYFKVRSRFGLKLDASLQAIYENKGILLKELSPVIVHSFTGKS